MISRRCCWVLRRAPLLPWTAEPTSTSPMTASRDPCSAFNQESALLRSLRASTSSRFLEFLSQWLPATAGAEVGAPAVVQHAVTSCRQLALLMATSDSARNLLGCSVASANFEGCGSAGPLLLQPIPLDVNRSECNGLQVPSSVFSANKPPTSCPRQR